MHGNEDYGDAMEMVTFNSKNNRKNNNTKINNIGKTCRSNSTEDKEQQPLEHERTQNRKSIPILNTPTVSGWTQLRALLHKNYIIQINRNLSSTIIDILVVPILIAFLVLIYNQTSVLYFDQHSFSNVNITFPSNALMETFVPFYDGGGDGRSLGHFDRDMVRRLLTNDAFQRMHDEEEEEVAAATITATAAATTAAATTTAATTTITAATAATAATSATRGRRLEEQEEGLSFAGGGVPNEIPFKKNPHKKNDVMRQLFLLHEQLQSLLDGPLAIPTLDQYIYMSDIVNSIVKPKDMNAMLQSSDFFRIWGNMITLGTIHITPRNHELMDDLLLFWREEYRITRNLLRIRVHETKEKAMEYIYDHLDERTWALIHIGNTTDNPNPNPNTSTSNLQDLQFTIRMNYTTIPNTARISNEMAVGLNTEYQQYYLSGFLTLQQTLDDFIMDYSAKKDGFSNCTHADHTMKRRVSMPLPTPPYAQNPFYFIAGMFFSLYIIIIFLYPSSKCIKHLVEEKETRMKQTLQILGIKPWAYYFSWIITSFATFFMIAVLVTLLLSNSIFYHTSTGLLFIYILFFGCSIISFSFFISSFFSNANLASLAGPIALFVTMLPKSIFRTTNVYEAATLKSFVSLLPCTAFALGLDIMIEYEYATIGLNWHNAAIGNFTFYSSLFMLAFDTFFYMFLAWYLDCVLPTQFGTPKPWYFLCRLEFWRSFFTTANGSGQSSKIRKTTNKGVYDQLLLDDEEEETIDINQQEEQQAAVQIINLIKRYPNSTVNSVNKLNLSLYPNEITCLLGHNGAGKTSTISILTGLYTPTSGDVIVHGKSIISDLDTIRQSMGICPQYDVLFDDLSVYEHLYFIQWIKGCYPIQDDTIFELAKQVGLQNKLHALAKTLTGGMKRKLSVAIAFAGNPKFVLLDEPTSGMDPLSRRVIWDLLSNKKNEIKDRVILLTTHYMEEAEILANNIAIMKLGRLQSEGNLLALKRRYGLGYKLRALLSHNTDKVVDTTSNMSKDVDLSTMTAKTTTSTESALDYVQYTNFHIDDDDATCSSTSSKEIELSPMNVSASTTTTSTSVSSNYLPLINNEHDYNNNHTIPTSTSTSKSTQQQNDTKNINSILKFLHTYIPETKFIRQSGRELTYRFPTQCEELFPTLFDAFHTNSNLVKEEFGLVSYGITNTTLDDVFLQLAEEEDNADDTNDITIISPTKPKKQQQQQQQHPCVNIQDVITNTSSFIKHETTFWEQTYILFLKRCTVQRRDVKGTFFLIVLPAIMITLAFAVLVIENNPVGPPLVFDMDILGHTMIDLDGGGGSNAENGWENNVTKQVLFGYNNNNKDIEKEDNNNHHMKQQLKDLMTVFSSSTSYNKNDNRIDYNPSSKQTSNKQKHQTRLEYDILQQSTNSSQFSRQILDTYNQNNYYTSYYGAYILNDVMNISLDIHWNNLIALVSSLYSNKLNTQKQHKQHDEKEKNHTQTASDTDYGTISRNRKTTIDEYYESPTTKNIESLYDKDININDFINDLKNSSDDVATWQIIRDVVLEQASSFIPNDIDTDSNTVSTYHPHYSVNVSILHNSSTPHAIAILNHAYSTYLYQKCTKESSSSSSSAQQRDTTTTSSSSPKVVSIVNHPLPLTSQQRIEERVILSGIVVFFLLVPLCYIPGAFIVFTVRENTCKAKHVQLVSGVDMLAYWVSNYCFDLLLYLFISLTTSMILLAYGRDVAVTFIGDFNTGLCSFLLIFGYGVSAIPLAYIISRQFRNSTSAQIVVISISFLTGLISTLLYYILKGLHMKHIYKGLMKVCRLFPSFNVGVGLFDMATTYWYRVFLHTDSTPFDSKITWDSVVYLYGLAIPYFCILLLLEYSSDGGSGGSAGQTLRWFRESFDQTRLKRLGSSFFSCNNAVVNDEDVEKERIFISSHKAELKNSASILLADLWKVYPMRKQYNHHNIFLSLFYSIGQIACDFLSIIQNTSVFQNNIMHNFYRALNVTGDVNTIATGDDSMSNDNTPSNDTDFKVAIRGLNMAIQQGETFGLLGVNGAGKTSTLSILTGDLKPTHGEVYVAGHDMSGRSMDGVTKARKCIGYCPQSDPLLEWMTARETLVMFGKLRGISSDYLHLAVDSLVQALGLTRCADMISGSYSGGNKRKLSLGVAVIGNPRVLFIDEASSGMDPLSRHLLWELISLVSTKRSVIITTHSMEEAEALCSKVAIMANGQMRCIGSIQHLKDTFLNGYSLDVQCHAHTSSHIIDLVQRKVLDEFFPGCSKLSERHGTCLKFLLTKCKHADIGNIFRLMWGMKCDSSTMIEDYSISQVTLEQLFINISKEVSEDHKSLV